MMGYHSEAAFRQFEREYAEAEERQDIARESARLTLVRSIDHRAETEARTAAFWAAEEGERLAPIRAQYAAAMAGWGRLPTPKPVIEVDLDEPDPDYLPGGKDYEDDRRMWFGDEAPEPDYWEV